MAVRGSPTDLGQGVATSESGPGSAAPRTAPPVALYVHIPFCLSICPYCDFVVYAGAAARGSRSRVAAFLEALACEIDLRAAAVRRAFPVRPPLSTVYLGGGTPSLLPAEAVGQLLTLVRDGFGVAARAEITIEANPGPEDRGDLGGFAGVGINRVSFGAQSFDADELRRLGRRHTPGDLVAAVAQARGAGIGSVNLDLLYDVPGQSIDSWERSLRAALALEPDHLSLYALTLDDPDEEGITGGTGDHLPTKPGARRWREAATREQDDDRAATQYQRAAELLASEGWRGYELSNWARPGHESRHNLAYWERRPYEAVGPGAHAFDGSTRRWNAARLDSYVAALCPPDGSEPRLPPGGAEDLDAEAAIAEEVVLALRLDRGIEGALERGPRFGEALRWGLDTGLLERFHDETGRRRLRLTLRGRLLSNELFVRLI